MAATLFAATFVSLILALPVSFLLILLKLAGIFNVVIKLVADWPGPNAADLKPDAFKFVLLVTAVEIDESDIKLFDEVVETILEMALFEVVGVIAWHLMLAALLNFAEVMVIYLVVALGAVVGVSLLIMSDELRAGELYELPFSLMDTAWGALDIEVVLVVFMGRIVALFCGVVVNMRIELSWVMLVPAACLFCMLFFLFMPVEVDLRLLCLPVVGLPLQPTEPTLLFSCLMTWTDVLTSPKLSEIKIYSLQNSINWKGLQIKNFIVSHKILNQIVLNK